MSESKQFNFTDRALKELPPHPKDARSRESEYSDLTVRGLKLLCGKSGTKVFYLRTRVGRNQRATIRIGEFGPLSVKVARSKANEIKAHIALHGKLPERNKPTCAPVFRRFIEEEYAPWCKANKRSWRTEQSMLRKYLLPLWGRKRVDEVTHRDVVRYITETKENLSPSTANRHLAFIHRFYELLITSWQLMPVGSNPADGIKPYPEPKHRDRYLTAEEMGRLFRALDEEPNRVAAAALKFLALTGMRKGEAMCARWDCYDPERKILLIPMSKSGKHRYIPLNDMAADIIESQERYPDNPHIFVGREPGNHIRALDKHFRRARERARLVGVVIHSLRHSYASALIQSGVNLPEIQALLGHSNIRMTQRYAHLCPDALRNATDRAAQFVHQGVTSQT